MLAVTISRGLSYSSWTVQANIFTSVWQSFVGTQRFSHSCSSQIQPICVSLLTYHSLEVWRVVSGRNSTCGTRTTLAFYEEICSSPLLQAATESILQSKPGLIGNGFRRQDYFHGILMQWTWQGWDLVQCFRMKQERNWPAQHDNPSTIRVASVIGFSVCSLFSVLCYIFSNPTAVAPFINNGRI